jgi:hypothetical protein
MWLVPAAALVGVTEEPITKQDMSSAQYLTPSQAQAPIKCWLGDGPWTDAPSTNLQAVRRFVSEVPGGGWSCPRLAPHLSSLSRSAFSFADVS